MEDSQWRRRFEPMWSKFQLKYYVGWPSASYHCSSPQNSIIGAHHLIYNLSGKGFPVHEEVNPLKWIRTEMDQKRNKEKKNLIGLILVLL